MSTLKQCASALTAALAWGMLISGPAKTSTVIMHDNGRYVAVHTRSGILQFWKQGARAFEWSNNTIGSGTGTSGTTSRLAYFAFRQNGQILAVVRNGDVVVLSPTGKLLLRAKPIGRGDSQ